MRFKKKVNPFKKELLLDILESSRDPSNGSIDKYRAADALLDIFKFKKSKEDKIFGKILKKTKKIKQD